MDEDIIIKRSSLKKIAEALKSKSGDFKRLTFPDGFVEAIKSLPNKSETCEGYVEKLNQDQIEIPLDTKNPKVAVLTLEIHSYDLTIPVFAAALIQNGQILNTSPDITMIIQSNSLTIIPNLIHKSDFVTDIHWQVFC